MTPAPGKSENARVGACRHRYDKLLTAARLRVARVFNARWRLPRKKARP